MKTNMQFDIIFSESKWAILEELSKSPKSPIELSQIFKTTIANISQQLRLMEAIGVVSKTKLSNSQKGKPRTQYFINDELLYIVKLGKESAVKKMLHQKPHIEFTFNVLSKIDEKDQFYFLRFFWNNIEILFKSSIALFKNSDKTTEFFIITEDIENARKKLSNQEVKKISGAARKIICWTHNSFEIENGLKEKDPHFLDMIKDSTTLLDPSKYFEKYKKEAFK